METKFRQNFAEIINPGLHPLGLPLSLCAIVSAAAGGLRLAAMLTRGDVLPMLSVILPFVLGVIVLPPLFACLGEEEKGSHGCCRVGILPRDVTFAEDRVNLTVMAVFSSKISLSKLHYLPITLNFFISCIEH